MQEELILLARIRKPHGLEGEIIADTFVMDDKRFRKLKRVFLRNKAGETSEQIIEHVKLTPNGVIIKFDAVSDRDGADALRNQEVMIPLSEREPLPEGHAYFDEIVGMIVLDDESDDEIGVVREVLDMPAAEVYVIDRGDGTEVLVSGAGEEIISLDKVTKVMRVRLLEEY